MQTTDVDPATHSGVAKAFGMVYLFQALACLSLVLSIQLYAGYFSLYFAILAVVCIVIAVAMCVPAAASVAVPEGQSGLLQAALVGAWSAVLLLSTFVLSGHFVAAPDIPYMTLFLRRELLGAITGALLILAAASVVRMLRQLKGRNGAFILLAGLGLVAMFGLVWAHFEPLCVLKDGQGAGNAWRSECPLPSAFDHNVMFAVLLMVANVLAAEGVLRLMAAGSGVEGYAEIIPIISS